MLWMSEHNFPFGLVSFCGSLSTVDIQRHKVEYLKNLATNVSYEQSSQEGESIQEILVTTGVSYEQSSLEGAGYPRNKS